MQKATKGLYFPCTGEEPLTHSRSTESNEGFPDALKSHLNEVSLHRLLCLHLQTSFSQNLFVSTMLSSSDLPTHFRYSTSSLEKSLHVLLAILQSLLKIVLLLLQVVDLLDHCFGVFRLIRLHVLRSRIDEPGTKGQPLE